MVGCFKHSSSVFKQYYTHFYTFFHSHVFQKTTNNTIQTPLPNWLSVKAYANSTVLGGYLCFMANSFLKYNDVWLMKEYGVKSSWTWISKIKQGTVPWNFHHCKPSNIFQKWQESYVEGIKLRKFNEFVIICLICQSQNNYLLDHIHVISVV